MRPHASTPITALRPPARWALLIAWLGSLALLGGCTSMRSAVGYYGVSSFSVQ